MEDGFRKVPACRATLARHTSSPHRLTHTRTHTQPIQVFPDLEKYIQHTTVGTPLSTNRFLGTTQGECYGRSATPTRWLCPDLSPHTPVTNLLLTGQDIITLGLTGGIAAGYLTANVLAGYGCWENLILQRELVEDLGLPKFFE